VYSKGCDVSFFDVYQRGRGFQTLFLAERDLEIAANSNLEVVEWKRNIKL
jgi:hypothetical protein